MKICIIGSGISGLSVANILHARHQVNVLEKTKTPGGLIKCTREEGNLFHRVGGHVFNSKNPKVLDWFWSFFDREKEFLKAKRNAKIYMDGKFFGYPLENYIYKLPPQVVSNILEDLLKDREPKTYSNFAEFLKGNFGETLYELYFRPYNEKIWNTDLSRIPLEWLEGKLPMPDVKEILLSNILKKEEQNMVHASFYYPKYGGSQFIVNRLAEPLNVITGREVKKISGAESGWLIDNEPYDAVVYTGDIRRLPNIYADAPDTLSKKLTAAQRFLSNGTSNVLCYTDDTDLSWLYFPEKTLIPHRIIYTGNFSDTNNADSRKTCVVEFSGKRSKENMTSELAKMPGNLRPVAYNYEPNSYVVNTFETRKTVQAIKNELAGKRFFLLGRFAEWEYYNMDKCIEAAFEIANRINSNLNETI